MASVGVEFTMMRRVVSVEMMDVRYGLRWTSIDICVTKGG